MNDQVVFRLIKIIADNCFDGHFSLLKFTSEWRLSFGPQNTYGRDDVSAMPKGTTLLETFVNAIEAAEFREPRRPVKE